MKVIREIMSEPNGGTLSWGRVASTLALVAAIAWVSKIVLHTHTLPAVDGISAFVVAPSASNKVATAVQSQVNKASSQAN